MKQVLPTMLMPPLNASADPEFNSLAIAPIPPILGTDTDAARQFYRTGVSQLRMPPLPTQAKPAAGASAQSQIIVNQIVGGGTGGTGGTTTSFQVNNVINPIQNILNITGPGVSYGPGKGQVSIFASYQTVEAAGVAKPVETILNFLSPFTATDNPGNGSTDIGISFASLSYQVVQQVGTSKPAEPRLNFLAPITATDNPGNTSTDINVPAMVGDSGSGGVKGLVPAPPSGSFASGEFLTAGGTWAIPPGTGGAAFYQTVQQAGSSKPQEARLNFLSPFVVTDNPGNTSSDISINIPGITAFTNKDLGSTVGISASTQTFIDSIPVLFPSTGGPYYVRVSYYYSKSGGVDFVGWAADISLIHKFAGCQGTTSNNKSAISASGLSPVTYAAGTSQIFSVYIVDSGSCTIETSTFNLSPAGVPCYMQVEIIEA